MSEDPDFAKREEERLMRNLNKKRNPTLSNFEDKKKKEAAQQQQQQNKDSQKQQLEAKKKAEFTYKKQQEEAEVAKKKAEDEVKKKKMEEYMKEKKEEEEIAKQQANAQKDQQQKHQQQQIQELREESAKREVDEHPHTRNFDPKEDEEKLRREAARMAKMFGGLGLSQDKLLSGSPKQEKKSHDNDTPHTPYSDLVETAPTNNFKVDEDEKANREAERIQRQLAGKTREWKREGISREEEEAKEKEKRLRDLKEKVELLGPQLSNDPKEFSKAFLNDPEMAARLKLASGTKAEHTLAGVHIPGGHEFGHTQ